MSRGGLRHVGQVVFCFTPDNNQIAVLIHVHRVTCSFDRPIRGVWVCVNAAPLDFEMAVVEVLASDLNHILNENPNKQVAEVVFVLVLAAKEEDSAVDDGEAVAVSGTRYVSSLLALEPPEHFILASPLL